MSPASADRCVSCVVVPGCVQCFGAVAAGLRLRGRRDSSMSVPVGTRKMVNYTHKPGSSYPEGNFGGNQLLDGSISLSPLYPNLTIDLHVRTATSFHQSFLWLHPIQA